jgi:hypothetical protein
VAEDSAPVFVLPVFFGMVNSCERKPAADGETCSTAFLQRRLMISFRCAYVLEMKGHGVWQKLNKKR